MAHDDTLLQDAAQDALQAMRAAGFDHAQVTASRLRLDELNVNHNEPSLLRSTSSAKLALVGILDGRMGSTEVPAISGGLVRDAVTALFGDARSAPQDGANAVSSGQHARIRQGPQEGERDMLAGCDPATFEPSRGTLHFGPGLSETERGATRNR